MLVDAMTHNVLHLKQIHSIIQYTKVRRQLLVVFYKFKSYNHLYEYECSLLCR